MSATGLAGVAAGVPYVAHRPAVAGAQAPLVIVLHLMDTPWDESTMAAALPLAGVPAWRAYLGLQMFGARAPAGGPDELERLGSEDPLLKLLGAVVEQAAHELPGAVAGLREQLPVGKGPVVLVGASAGATAVLLALAEGQVPVRAAVLINPAVRAADVVAAGKVAYEWTDTSRRLAQRLDFVSRAGDIASRLPQPGVLIVNGEQDDPAFLGSADALYEALSSRWWSPAQVEKVRIPQVRHPLAVDGVVVPWLTRRLAG